MSRIESLRLFLEMSMGMDWFLKAYRILDSVQESDDDGEQMLQGVLPFDMHKFVPVISQLLVCEAFFNRQV